MRFQLLISVQDVEKELEVQIGMKQEMELSMKMLEKDVCEKQDALVELRQQLEDLRAINQQLGHKSQVNCLHLCREGPRCFTGSRIRLQIQFQQLMKTVHKSNVQCCCGSNKS